MITKERLEELIEKEATIWAVYDEDRMERIKLVVKMMGVSVDEYNKIHNCEPMLYSQFCGIVRDICPISWLFETEEDAKWHKEFGCIERTERLELPNWEELQNKREFYLGFNNKEGIVRYYLAIDMPYQKDCGAILISYSDANNDTILCFNKIATKENYIKACRKAKELFLGEKSDD